MRLARVQYWIGRIHYYRDEPREAIGYFQQVLAVGQELGDEDCWPSRWRSWGGRWWCRATSTGDPLAGRRHRPAGEGERMAGLGLSMAYHGVAVTATGLPKEGMAETEQAVARARETKSPTILAGCLIVLGFQSFLTRDLQAFRATAHSASETGREAGNSLMISDGSGLRGLGAGHAGRSDEAEERMADAQAGRRRSEADWWRPTGSRRAARRSP